MALMLVADAPFLCKTIEEKVGNLKVLSRACIFSIQPLFTADLDIKVEKDGHKIDVVGGTSILGRYRIPPPETIPGVGNRFVGLATFAYRAVGDVRDCRMCVVRSSEDIPTLERRVNERAASIAGRFPYEDGWQFHTTRGDEIKL